MSLHHLPTTIKQMFVINIFLQHSRTESIACISHSHVLHIIIKMNDKKIGICEMFYLGAQIKLFKVLQYARCAQAMHMQYIRIDIGMFSAGRIQQ